MKFYGNIFWELVLLVSSVLVFRSLWSLLDRVSFFNYFEVHLFLLVLGIAFSVWALNELFHISKR